MQIFQQILQIFLHHAPHDPVVQPIVVVNQDVPKRDDAPVLSNSVQDLGILTPYPSKGLADDAELSLDRAPEELIGRILGKHLARDESEHCRRRFVSVIEPLQDLVSHKRERARGAPYVEGTGSSGYSP
ncbi:MAG: hypothetical protein MI919_05710 [Holophagales bacterium]|nr:hypothetical protein [Holophagales bacterium]